MKILLTGAAGFLGLAVLEQLRARGWRANVVVRPHQAARLAQHPGVARMVTSRDIFAEPRAWWAQQCEPVQAVMHLAWAVQAPDYAHSLQNLHCLSGTLRLAQACTQTKVAQLLVAGTGFEYAPSRKKLGTHAPLAPTTAYGAAKAAAYHCLSRTLPQQGVSLAWCRMFYLYGDLAHPEPSSRWLAQLRQQLVTGRTMVVNDPNAVRDFLPVRLAAQGLVQALESRVSGALNLCSGHGQTRWDFAQKIARQYKAQHLLARGANSRASQQPPYFVGIPSTLPGIFPAKAWEPIPPW